MIRSVVHAAALASLVACGGGDPAIPDAAAVADANGIDAAPPRERIADPQVLQVNGGAVEGIMHGGPGDVVLLHFEAPANSLSWNLHTHLDGGTQVIVEEFERSVVDFRFEPPRVADWYLLLRNDGLTDIEVKIDVGLYGNVTWRWQ